MRVETARRDHASQNYAVTGSRILELAPDAAMLFERQEPAEQARLLRHYFELHVRPRKSLSHLHFAV